MPRYVMANRRAGKFRESDKAASREAVAMALSTFTGINVVHDNSPEDTYARRVVVFDG